MPKFDDFQRNEFRLLEQIKQDQKEIKTELSEIRKLLNNSASTTNNSTSVNVVLSECDFPVKNSEGLKNLDLYLADSEKFAQLCSYFGGIGGGNAPVVVRKILATILTNHLSKSYNWRGTGGVKLAFSEFKNIVRLIISSVRQHRGLEKSTDAEVHNTIKKWLVYANDREGGRASRRKLDINTDFNTVMPQLLNYLSLDSIEDSVDWGTLAVYTCSESCDRGVEGYVKESVWKQDFSNHQ